MAWEYINFDYPVPNLFEKHLVWLSADCNMYFAMKLNKSDSWNYYAGNGSHALLSGKILTSYGNSEANAQTNYLTTTKDSDNKVLAILPSVVQSRYIRMYIESGDTITVYEYRPSTRITAHDIVTGNLEITDELSEAPSITVTVSDQERIFIGDLGSDTYGLRGKDSSGNVIFELSSDDSLPYVSSYADTQALELELMKMNFQNISWTQFAVYDAVNDETKRASPDPSTYDASVDKSRITNGSDTTVDKEFGFVSKTYTDITTVETSTSTSVGLNFLTDTNKSWFTDEVKSLTLVDSIAQEFTVVSNTSDTLTISGTPNSGAYSLIEDDPSFAVAFCSYLDSTNGGTGYVKLEVSFDSGSNYQTFLDTENSVDLLNATVAIGNAGNDYIVRLTLKNDGSGDGSIVYNFLTCTDPSPWRW